MPGLAAEDTPRCANDRLAARKSSKTLEESPIALRHRVSECRAQVSHCATAQADT